MYSAVRTVVKENIDNWPRTLRLAIYEFKSQFNNTWLGVVWSFLNPILQLSVLQIVFSIGLRGGAPVDGFPFILWMTVGFMPWIFMSSLLTGTAQVFHRYRGVISNVAMPLSIIPVKTIIAAFFQHCMSMLIVVAIFLATGNWFTPSVVFLLYYAFAALCFFVGYSLIVSTLQILYADFHRFLNHIVRFCFFMTPIVWTFDRLTPAQAQILRLVPFGYIIEGYRAAILYNAGPMSHWRYGIYFWALTIIMFMLGCVLHCRFRKKFIDLL